MEMSIACQKTDETKQANETTPEVVQTQLEEAYAKAFIDKSTKGQGLLLREIGPLIEDKKMAIAVSEAILFKVYGEENIKGQRPYGVYKTDLYWVLTGTLPEGYVGGVFEIAIDANDARVIGLAHGK
jgi:hypothetical protein